MEWSYNSVISPDAHKILDEARQLPPEQRQWLAECLLINDEQISAADIESSWNEEIERRLEEIDPGAAELIPGEEVFAELEAKLSPEPRAQ